MPGPADHGRARGSLLVLYEMRGQPLMAENVNVVENYPGELVALRGLVGQARAIAAHGSMEELRAALAEHGQEEAAALAKLPEVPKVGALYELRRPHGGPDRVARVLDGGLWRKEVLVDGEYHARRYRRSSLRHESEDRKPVEPGVSMAGRLILTTTGGQVSGHPSEIRALRLFEIPPLPAAEGPLWRALAALEMSAKTAGLLLDVKPGNQLREMEGESYG
jgi:hypothetical protein